jgi:hypothetical protein
MLYLKRLSVNEEYLNVQNMVTCRAYKRSWLGGGKRGYDFTSDFDAQGQPYLLTDMKSSTFDKK